ncbi:putative 28S rRNA (cytosine-C(5))-methyltransferase [Microtus ochrogaster]|uniref:Putative 28S rRNA (Cytosine-C(5))-methyltransferase n=1 Tax=Microtus ochrogaster TaxID=79684 RepID=A0A8J6G7H7_MICOH|nr:putative 28S rRNA (cytosine-C(5))-methyltransferase [Microtus ochrogaster]
MGRKLDPTKKEKRGPGRKARKQKGAETELVRFLPAGAVQARGKKRPAPAENSDGDEEEESEEEAVANQGDLWGSEDSDADMVDDYGADSGSEDEEGKLLPIERAALKRKSREAAAGKHSNSYPYGA